jgi:multicomponent Na+:H+ antiporter subunit C
VTTSTLFSICGAILVGIGAFGLFAHAHLVRRILAFNVVGSGIFLVFGGLGYRHPEVGADPVPQAMVITGIVVALAATALAVTLAVRLFEETGRTTLPGEGSADEPGID